MHQAFMFDWTLNECAWQTKIASPPPITLLNATLLNAWITPTAPDLAVAI
jgi:hypothetical protein